MPIPSGVFDNMRGIAVNHTEQEAIRPSRPATVSSNYPAFAPLNEWCRISGMSRTGTYCALGRGELKAIKAGARTLIDVEAGLAWLRSLPAAEIKAPKTAA